MLTTDAQNAKALSEGTSWPATYLARSLTGLVAPERIDHDPKFNSTPSSVKCFVPAIYMIENNALKANAWFYANLKRAEAEQMLESDENDRGSFLVRFSDSRLAGANYHCLSLSVRQGNKEVGFYM